jgi:hypothetical protein
MKVTIDQIAAVVPSCFSFSQVCRAVGLRADGNASAHVKKRIVRAGIDYSHFTGQRTNAGESHSGGRVGRDKKEILVKRTDGVKENVSSLRRALLASGVAHVCSDCGLGNLWNGKEITLQCDHVNGDTMDNRIENLRFLCPNCHSQTPNFGSKNKISHSYVTTLAIEKKEKNSAVIHNCGGCGKPIWKTSTRCKTCAGLLKSPTKIQWPSVESLKKMVEETSYTAVGRRLGVSDNAIRKRLKKHKSNGQVVE